MNELESATIEKQKNECIATNRWKSLNYEKTKPCCKENENVRQINLQK
jgi:hypothetical protein